MKKKKVIKKNKDFISDNRKELNMLVKKIYSSILNLDTETLQQHSFEVYRELISRKDYYEIDDIIGKYLILYDELKKRGVDVSCLM